MIFWCCVIIGFFFQVCLEFVYDEFISLCSYCVFYDECEVM